jgi:hypothetical protein
MKPEQRLELPSPEVRHRALLLRDLMLQFEAISETEGKLGIASIREVWRRAHAQKPDVRGISIASLLRCWMKWTRTDHRFGLISARPSKMTRCRQHR